MTTSIPKHRNAGRAHSVAAAKQQMVDKVGSAGWDYTLEDGHRFHLVFPPFRSSTTRKALKAIKEDDDWDGVAKILLGDKGYEEYLEHGGDPDDLPFCFQEMGEHLEASLNPKPGDDGDDETPTD